MLPYRSQKSNNRYQSIFASLADGSSGVLTGAWHIARTHVLLQTARHKAQESTWAPANWDRKGFCFSCHRPEQTFAGCSPTPFSGGRCLDSRVPRPAEVTCDCVIAAARRFGLCSGQSPRCPGHISSPPRSFAMLGKESRMSSVNRPRQRCQTRCRAGGRGKEPNRVVQSSADRCCFLPRPNTLGCGVSPADPEAVPRSPSTVTGKWQHRRPRASHHEQLCSTKIPPRKGPQLSTPALIKAGL